MSIPSGKITSEKKDIPFYEKDSSYKICGIMSLAGPALMIVGTFFNWISLFVKTTEKERGGISVFKAVYENVRGGVKIGTLLPAFILLLYYAVVVFLLFLGFKDNIQKQPFLIKRKKRIRLFALVIAIILMIVIVNLPAMRENLERFYALRDSWKSFVESSKENGIPGSEYMRCRLTIGLGFIMYILGALAYLGSVLFGFVLDTLNED